MHAEARASGGNRPAAPQPVGVVGCGTIGRAILRAVDEGRLPVPLAGVTSRSAERTQAFLRELRHAPPYLALDALIERSALVVEAAGGGVVAELARSVFAAGKDLMVISVGALLEHPELLAEARRRNCRLLLPSGAIAGVDGIKSACAGHVEHVTITTRKGPRGLAGAPYLRERGIDPLAFEAETEVFHGSVREACRGFPENVNVSATVSLAGIGPDLTTIRILAVPGLTHNCHTIDVEGEFGSLRVDIRNVPTENPKTGRLTALSIVRSIADAMDPVRVGT